MIGSILLIGLFIFIIYLGYKAEKIAYNGGVCPRCGGKLRHFDTDSQGGRGYCCDKCKNYITWMSLFEPEIVKVNKFNMLEMKCPKCGHIFNDYYGENAVINKDTGEMIDYIKYYQCPKCDSMFNIETGKLVDYDDIRI